MVENHKWFDGGAKAPENAARSAAARRVNAEGVNNPPPSTKQKKPLRHVGVVESHKWFDGGAKAPGIAAKSRGPRGGKLPFLLLSKVQQLVASGNAGKIR